nr:7023_t:CDS:2 [Entrophospora candida]
MEIMKPANQEISEGLLLIYTLNSKSNESTRNFDDAGALTHINMNKILSDLNGGKVIVGNLVVVAEKKLVWYTLRNVTFDISANKQ